MAKVNVPNSSEAVRCVNGGSIRQGARRWAPERVHLHREFSKSLIAGRECARDELAAEVAVGDHRIRCRRFVDGIMCAWLVT